VARLRATTHQLTGVGAAVVCAAALDLHTGAAAVLVGTAWLGALLPDADRAGARLYRATRVERRVLPLRVLGALARLPLRALILLGHRGPTHSLFAAALVAAAVDLLAGAIPAAGLAIGYVAHIAGDACTPGGVPAWAPLSRRRHWLLPGPARIPTGSLREYVFAGLFTAALVAAVALM
jgi:membrane-bound metal-dependent hydrolase YbcI (DUF457 family)